MAEIGAASAIIAPAGTRTANSPSRMAAGFCARAIAPMNSAPPVGRLEDAAIESLERHLAATPMIHRAVASAQAAVLEINHAKVRSWALAQGLPASTFRSLAALPELRALLSRELQDQSPGSSKIPEFRVLAPDPFSRADGLLTATGTVRRDAVLKKFVERAAIGEDVHAVLH
jgi:hypothetical protein